MQSWLSQKLSGGLYGSHGGESLLSWPQPPPLVSVGVVSVGVVSVGVVSVVVVFVGTWGGEADEVACELVLDGAVDAQPAIARTATTARTTVRLLGPTQPLSIRSPDRASHGLAS